MTECYEITQGMVTSNTLKTQIERSPSFLLSQKKRLNKFSEAQTQKLKEIQRGRTATPNVHRISQDFTDALSTQL